MAFVHGNPGSRRVLWTNFMAFVQWVRQLGVFRTIYIDGSFVTDKPDPGDIDVILELPPAGSPSVPRAAGVIVNSRVFDHVYTKGRFNLHVFPSVDSTILAFFQGMRPQEELARGLPPGSLRGILRVEL